MVYRCDFCSRSFSTPSALQTHAASSIHSPRPYCETCIEWFPTEILLKQHLATDPAHRSSTPPTFDCTQTSDQLEERTQNSISHRYTVGKFYCDDCVLWFSDQNALDRHLQDAEEHASQFACVECGREFNSRRELEAHVLMGVLCRHGVGENELVEENKSVDDETSAERRNLPQEGPKFIPSTASHGSYSKGDIDPPYLYEGNIRYTDSSAANSQYVSQPLHACGSPSGPQTYHCLGRTCLRTFASPSALLQHLDSGACPSGVNRHIVNSATIALDHGSAITNRLLRAAAGRNIHEIDPDEEEADIATRYHAQAPPGGRRPLLMGRPQLPWGVRNLDELPDLCCPLCPKHSSPFRTATALHAHMTSAVHDARIYHCSSTSSSSASDSDAIHKSRNFSTLGALAQHLESRGCSMNVPAGAKRFNDTMREVQERLRDVELETREGGVTFQGLEW
ncbi:hypothetical protein BGX38DRAFT_1266192 [Terfezia claveryi]|nr:hypothetical protein BGX38DRAFT_1266192 [Terfezia claveryi]